MTRPQLRGLALACLVGAVGFTGFFFAAKHQPWLARVAPFGDDPYDAMGSFAVQAAVVAAALSVLRAMQRHGGAGIPDARASLVLRGSVIALLAVFVAVISDLVAMLRHPDAWLRIPVGRTLGLGLGIIALAAGGAAVLLARRAGGALRAAAPARGPSAAAITVAGAATLWLYPEAWRRGVVGAILTAMFGMALLFTQTWALSRALVPGAPGESEDLLDDLHAPKRVARWLRAHPWRFALWIGVAGGLALALLEALGEGLPASARRALLVLGVFTGIEAAAIVLGFALFRRQLRLLRED
jgi:hypothetical protein